MPVVENKKIILMAGCLAIFFPGAFVFGFPGVMALQWQAMFQADKAQVGQLMFFVLAGTGCSMYLSGKLLEKMSVNKVVFSGSFMCALSTFFVAHASSMNHVYIWTFAEGFFCGFVYVPCLILFQRLFPENKGLVTGIVNLTFGGAAAIMSPVYNSLLISKGYLFTSYFAASTALVIGGVSALFVRLPEQYKLYEKKNDTNFSLKAILRMKAFWYLWLVWAFAGASGVSLIVLASSYGSHLGYGITRYVFILTCFNILNGAGRLICGRLADRYSKQKILMTVFLMASIAYLMMAFSSNLIMVSFFACFVGLAFGALFTVSAPLVTDVFSLENFGSVFGLIFTAYGFFSGFLGPWLGGMIIDRTHSNYTLVFTVFSIYYLISSILILKVKKNEND